MTNKISKENMDSSIGSLIVEECINIENDTLYRVPVSFSNKRRSYY